MILFIASMFTFHQYRIPFSLCVLALMYEKTLAFRADRAADTLLESFVEPRVLRHYFAEGFTGVDRQGFPVLIERIGTST